MEKNTTPSKESSRVFSLAEAVIREAAGCHAMTAIHIGALLTVACYTDRTGVYSTCGAYAVRNALKIGDKKASDILEELNQRGFIKSIDRLHKNSSLRKAMPDGQGKAQVRWIIEANADPQARRIWFPVKLIEGAGKWYKPLSDLRQCGNLAARMLIALYLHEDVCLYGGIDPTAAIHQTWKILGEPDEIFLQGCRYWLFTVEHFSTWVMESFWSNTLRVESDEDGKIPLLWPALKKLIDQGFIYRCLTVFAGNEIGPDMELLYPLHTFNRHGHPPKGEESLAFMTANIARNNGSPVDCEGRFSGDCFALVADTPEAQLVTIFRLRLRNVSPYNMDGKNGWSYVQQCRKRWGGILGEKD